jgi:hypothetical protein
MAAPTYLVARDDERRQRGLPVEPTGYIKCDGEAMKYWLPIGMRPEEIGLKPTPRGYNLARDDETRAAG